MDVFKLAFETIIVGLLAFAWLGIAIDLLFPDFFDESVPKLLAKYEKAIGLALLVIAYCLGSAIMPIAGQLVNDEHWPLHEDDIRCWAFIREKGMLANAALSTDLLDNYRSTKDYMSSDEFLNCHCSYVDIFLKTENSGSLKDGLRKDWSFPTSWHDFTIKKNEVANDKKRDTLLALFRVYESKVLGQSSDKNDSLRQLSERIIVLRGAVINSFMAFFLCLFRSMARCDKEKFQWNKVDRIWIKNVLGALLALGLTLFSFHNAIDDLQHPDIFDMPILETLLGLTSIFGGFWVIRGIPNRPRMFLNNRSVYLTAFITILAYGGWLWTELIYDQQIITAVAILQKGGGQP